MAKSAKCCMGFFPHSSRHPGGLNYNCCNFNARLQCNCRLRKCPNEVPEGCLGIGSMVPFISSLLSPAWRWGADQDSGFQSVSLGRPEVVKGPWYIHPQIVYIPLRPLSIENRTGTILPSSLVCSPQCWIKL